MKNLLLLTSLLLTICFAWSCCGTKSRSSASQEPSETSANVVQKMASPNASPDHAKIDSAKAANTLNKKTYAPKNNTDSR